jgi:hypothetical protein
MLALNAKSVPRQLLYRLSNFRLTRAACLREEAARVLIQMERLAQRLQSPVGALQVPARELILNTHRVGSCLDLSSPSLQHDHELTS